MSGIVACDEIDIIAKPLTHSTHTPVPQASSSDINNNGKTSRELKLGSTIVNEHWDVHLSTSPTLASFGPGIVYSRILRFDSTVNQYPTTSTECDICESWEYKSPNTYVFTIKNNVFWHDIPPVSGRLMNVNDILYSINRQRNSEGPNSQLLKSIKKVEVISKNKIKIDLHEPDSDFLINLSNGLNKIVAPEAVALTGDIKQGPVIGTGPWILQGTRQDLGYFFQANDQYYEQEMPGLDRLQILTIPNKETLVAAFMTKKLDLIETPNQYLHEILKVDQNISHLIYQETGVGLEMALNTSSPPLDQPLIRKAIFKAIDPWKAIDDVWAGLGFVSSGIPTSEPSWGLTRTELKNYLNNQEESINIITSLGSKDPISLELIVADYGDKYLEYGNHISNQLIETGFDIKMSIINPTDYPETIWYKGNYQMFIGPKAPVATSNMYLLSVIHSKGKWNTHGYNDITLDSLIEDQSTMNDRNQRKNIILDIQRKLMENNVRFMPLTNVSTWVWWPQVGNFNPNLTANEYIYLAKLTHITSER
jgi:ABC-type transport system substrate-binding protein